MNGIKLLVFILRHGRGETLLRISREAGVFLNLILQGHGTAGSELLTLLGIGDPQKDIVLLSVDEARADGLLRQMTEKLRLSKPGEGIAFSIPLCAIASQANSYEIMAGMPAPDGEWEKEDAPQKEAKGADKMESMDLIVTVINRGFADDVMAAARSAGASGGTVINGRGTGAHALDEYMGVQLQPEKELVLILTEREKRAGIMTAIARGAGLSKDSMGLCFSLPADSVAGLSGLEENA